MNIVPTFDSTKRRLQELLQKIDNGKMQLPDFQRSWVWDDARIRSLLASVSLSFPIGAIMLLEKGGEARFKPRPLEGTAPDLVNVVPETLILDGQQRLTSLYQSFIRETPAKTRDDRGKHISRRYYINMRMALEGIDREEALVSVPEDGMVKGFGRRTLLDLHNRDREFATDHFPLHLIFDSAKWRQDYYRYWSYDEERINLFDNFENEIIKRIEQYQVPVIELTRETPKEAVCLVFEKVNTGGVVLNVFELLTASFAADDFQLRKDWEKRERQLKEEFPVLRTLQSDDFLQTITLLVTKERRQSAKQNNATSDRAPAISCKRRDILRLTVEEYRCWADRVEQGFVNAARFLHSQKIFRAKDLPYRTQLIPLAAILVDLGDLGETEGARKKIARWFWCGVLGELYGSAVETRFTHDLPEVVEIVHGRGEPLTVQEATFLADRLLTLRTRNSAAYKGIYALLMREGCRDFRTGQSIEAQTFFDDDIDIHHIFPRSWCKEQGIDADKYNSIINKTAISARTNRKIGRKPPSIYLKNLEGAMDINSNHMDQIVASHCIEPGPLRRDDFWGFFVKRAKALLSLIESAIGKPLAHDLSPFQPEIQVEDYDEGPIDWEDLSMDVME